MYRREYFLDFLFTILYNNTIFLISQQLLYRYTIIICIFWCVKQYFYKKDVPFRYVYLIYELNLNYSNPPIDKNNGANTTETMVINLIRMLMDGPEVSLNGSPTVSPTTAAL